mgnify:CR=1 FL=1
MVDITVTLDQLISGEVPIPDAEDPSKEFVYRFLLPDGEVGLFSAAFPDDSMYKEEVLKGLIEIKAIIDSQGS